MLLLVAAVVVVLTGERIGVGLVAVALLLAGAGVAGRVFTVRVVLPAAEPPERAIVVWNPRSGGGKAVSNNLPDEARARGIEPIELKPGDDLEQLVRDAVAAGADGLAAAGGDGTQALVASIAAEHDLPFACIPAGTRNHFALDLGVDRDDVVGALDAFVTGGERRVDLAEVNGRVFVNNVSLGLYAEAVQREGYRDAKLRTMLDTAPDVLGSQPTGATSELSWRGPDGAEHQSAAVILVSNNTYRLGHVVGSGSRPRIDGGELGIAVLAASHDGGRRWQQWSVPDARDHCHPARSGRSRRGGARPRSAASVREQAGRAASPDRAATSRRVTVRRPAGAVVRPPRAALRRGPRTRLRRDGPVSAPVERWLGLTNGEKTPRPSSCERPLRERPDRARRAARVPRPRRASQDRRAVVGADARRRDIPADPHCTCLQRRRPRHPAGADDQPASGSCS